MGQNAFDCTNCSRRTPATKHFSVGRSPAMLVLHLKRFDGHTKLQQHVRFPLRGLDLARFSSSSSSSSSSSFSSSSSSSSSSSTTSTSSSMGNPAQDSDNRTYDLCGLIVHRGTSVHNGHYMAYVMPSPTQKRWFLCNDATVTPTSAHIVLEQQAYVLLYRRSPQSDGHELRARQDEGRRQHVLKYLYGKPMPTLPVVEPVCFISSYWLKKYDLGLETGPPSNACVLCKHGHLLSHERKCLKLAVDQGLLTARPVVPIPIRLWEWLSSRPPLSTSSSSAAATAANATSSCAMLRRQDTEGQCRACAEEGRIFTAQRQTEVDYFDFLTTDCVAEGENSDGFWYIIDAAWMRRWQTWFYNTRRVPPTILVELNN